MNQAMIPTNHTAFRLGDWLIEPAIDEVSRDGLAVKLEPRTMRVLVCLAQHAGEVVSVEQLLDAVWKDIVVTHDSVYRAVAGLRRALDDDPKSPVYIANVQRRGYRLIAPIAPAEPKPVSARAHTDSSAHIDAQGAQTPAAQGAREAAAAFSSPSATPPTSLITESVLGRPAWFGGALLVLAVLAVSYWALGHFRGASKPAALTSPQAPPAIHSLVVLPLENLSGDKEQEYFADGMTDALTTNLAQIGSLRVISRTSAMHFKDSKQTLPQIGRDLQVDAVVEGTVTRSADRVRITAQLVEASSDRHLWARSYERDLKNVLALQDEIAHEITEQIRVKLTPQERSLLIQVHAVDPEAHDAYLRGHYWAYKGTSEGAWKAIEYYQTAIAKDPNYALAYAGVADAYLSLTNWATQFSAPSRVLSPEEVSSKVKEAAVKAIELDPSLAEPHASLAATKLFSDWDFSGAAAEFKQAIALNPNLASAHGGYSYYLEFTERLDESVDESERARDLDPFELYANERLGQALYHARRYDDALRQLQRTVEMFPDWGERLYWEMAEVYEQKRMFAEAVATRQHALSLNNDPNVTALGEAYKRAGYRGYLLKRIQTLEQGPHQAFTFPYLAHLYATLNDEPHAMSCLERAYEEHNLAVLFMRTAPELDPIRSSPRFRELVRRIGLPPSPIDKN